MKKNNNFNGICNEEGKPLYQNHVGQLQNKIKAFDLIEKGNFLVSVI